MDLLLSKLYKSDRWLIIFSFILLGAGLIMVYTSSVMHKQNDPYFYLRKQFLWLIIGMILFLFFLNYDYRRLQKWVVPLLLITVILLVMVKVSGKTVNGAKRWIAFGPIGFQPSELAKLSIVIFLANYLDKNNSKIKKMNVFLVALSVVGLIAGLIALEPDLGTPVLIFIVTMLVFFIAGVKLLHISSLLLVSLPAIAYWGVYHVSYRWHRLVSFLDPFADTQGVSYQLYQSLLALGSGGVFGKGLGRSELKNNLLPELHTDFIFSIIGEESGLIGTIIIVGLFVCFLYRGFKIAKDAPDLFGTLVSTGITFFIVIQAFFNIGVCTGCLPTKGISLPFFSYGGSSLMITLAMLGILANISQYSCSPFSSLYKHSFRSRKYR